MQEISMDAKSISAILNNRDIVRNHWGQGRHQKQIWGGVPLTFDVFYAFLGFYNKKGFIWWRLLNPEKSPP